MNAEYRGKMPLPHIIQEYPAADSQAQYTAKPILPLVLAELNSYHRSLLDFIQQVVNDSIGIDAFRFAFKTEDEPMA